MINQAIANGTANASGGTLILGASPDWSMVGSHYGTGIAGSPSGPFKSYSPVSTASEPICSTSKRTVYVLDTSDSSFAGLVPNARFIIGNPILQTIVGTAPASAATPGQSEAPHGLFIAALIHNLASDAKIQVIQVLNDNGVGDLASLAWGLNQVPDDSNAIVNMSLETAVPPDLLLALWNCGAYTAEYGDTNGSPQTVPDPVAAGCTTSGDFSSNLAASYQQYLFVPIMSLLGFTSTTLVAAAGNDSTFSGGTENRVSAGMPAAFCDVTAVASVVSANSKTLSTFSNYNAVNDGNGNYDDCLLLQAPPSSLATVQLANIKGPGMQVAPGEGICSLIGQNQYAVWQGTSFAAALYSGNVARQPIGAKYLSGNLIDAQPCK
jgi:hypothetical protein